MKVAAAIFILATCQAILAAPPQDPVCLLPVKEACPELTHLIWYFNHQKGVCLKKMACILPNTNSFKTRAECERRCPPRRSELCNRLRAMIFKPEEAASIARMLRDNNCL
ncbi:uncharacterized protein LOC135170380 [Diachasmimorpha longicaudata]|uniref:uncharacterized protein LOC135170380 n=1 Tax=Diachasmimorpha longicaudata TaxID=58733 RepID=UPI0030B90DE1